MSKKEVKKQLKYKSISVDVSKIIQLVEYIDAQIVAIGEAYASLDVAVKLKGDITYTVHDAKELGEIFKSEFESIKSLSFRFYSDELVIYLDTHYNGVEIDISGNKDGVTLAFDEFKRLLDPTKNWNWIVPSLWLQVIAPVLMALSFVIFLLLSFQDYFRDNGIMKTVTIGVIIQLFIFAIFSYSEKYYPNLVIMKDGLRSARDFRSDWWKIVLAVPLPVVLGILVNKIS